MKKTRYGTSLAPEAPNRKDLEHTTTHSILLVDSCTEPLLLRKSGAKGISRLC
jgi:hypothetical protein